jgi:hypothetical protein
MHSLVLGLAGKETLGISFWLHLNSVKIVPVLFFVASVSLSA